MNEYRYGTLVALVAFTLMASPAFSQQEKGKGKDQQHEKQIQLGETSKHTQEIGSNQVKGKNTDKEKQRMEKKKKAGGETASQLSGPSYGRIAGELPPGLEKYKEKHGGQLPPGLEKQFKEKGHLPPGLQ